jgi:hypothetical protein
MKGINKLCVLFLPVPDAVEEENLLFWLFCAVLFGRGVKTERVQELVNECGNLAQGDGLVTLTTSQAAVTPGPRTEVTCQWDNSFRQSPLCFDQQPVH